MFKVHHWGEIEYELCIQRQREMVRKVKSSCEDHLIFCTHPPMVTLGRSSTQEDVGGWTGPIFKSCRGGKATYHGPSQIIVYPIIDLGRKRPNLRPRDVHHYLHFLEKWLVSSLKELSIQQARSRSTEVTRKNKKLSVTGVWVGEKKIASIGVAVKSWVTYHGVALNLTKDSKAFQGIHPCGFQNHIMTSVEEVLGKKLKRDDVTEVLRIQFQGIYR